MRLLHARTDGSPGFSLTTKHDDELPEYAILSHTWGSDYDEVVFEDIQNGSGLDKAGYAKLEFCAARAARDGLEYFWVDTCCIKKTDSTELNESLIRMFRWYAGAKICYVYLTDVDTTRRNLSMQEQFRQSRWFTRGWTLQELLAPRCVDFFSHDQERLGDKQSLAQEIHAVTAVPIDALSGTPLSQFVWRERMEWARYRTTKKEEDQAYCLMGIFSVNMIAMYGEGKAEAFRRLKKEIHAQFGHDLHAASTEPPEPGLTSRILPMLGSEDLPDSAAAKRRSQRQANLMSSLRFDVMDARRDNITSPYSTTCAWFLEESDYVDWDSMNRIQEHHGLLWIGGKPGAGKSTLMKYIHTHAVDSASPDDIIVSFFFNARGDKLEKSTLGMWRALLFQLFEKAPDLLYGLKDTILPVENRPVVWTVDSLSQLFNTAVKSLGHRRLKCFVDALDECDEDEVGEMAHFFELLGTEAVNSGHRLQFCFASRHYPAINVKYCQRVILEQQLGHIQDIADYVRSRLCISESSMLEGIRARIQAKANGVFMWVALVVSVLNKEYARGRMPALRKKLEDLPAKLSDLFRELLTRDTEDRADLILCLQLILFSRQQMSPQEFYSGMGASASTETSEAAGWDSCAVNDWDIARFVVSSSKGLVEVTTTYPPTVQFIHESVRDFLLKDNGLSELCPELGDELVPRSHERLKIICVDYLEFYGSANPNYRTAHTVFTVPVDGSMRPVKGHFLDYAFEAVLWHADQAAKTIPQDQFLRDFPLKLWFQLSRDATKFPCPSLEYCLAARNCHRLIRTLFPDQVAVDIQTKPHGCPLVAALLNGHAESVRAILNLSETYLIGEMAETGSKQIPPGQPTFLWIIENGYYIIASLVLTLLKPDVNQTDDHGRTALSLAIRCGCEELVGKLLAAGAHTDVVDDRGLPPLLVASQLGLASIVAMLLVHGASITRVDTLGRNALHLAAQHGFESVICVLLQCELDCARDDCPGRTSTLFPLHWRQKPTVDRADIMARDIFGQTPLHRAVSQHQKDAASLLLEHGAGIEARDAVGQSPLLIAADTLKLIALKYLLLRKSELVAKHGSQGYKDKYRADEDGYMEMVERLLKAGANVNAADTHRRTSLLLIAYGFNLYYRGTHSIHHNDDLARFGIKVLRILSAWGADPDVPDTAGLRLDSYAIGRRALRLGAPSPSQGIYWEHLSGWDSEDSGAGSVMQEEHVDGSPDYDSDGSEQAVTDMEVDSEGTASMDEALDDSGNDALRAVVGPSTSISPPASRGLRIDQLCN